MPQPIQNVAVFPAPDEMQTRALATDIQSQLTGLPTAITDDATYRRAKESLPLLKRAEDRVIGFFRDIKKAASDAHRAICAKENEQLVPIVQARKRLTPLIYAYEQEQARRKREAEERARHDEQRRREAEALADAEAMQAHSPEIAEQILEEAIAAPAPIVVLPSTTVDVAGVNDSKPHYVWRYLGAPDHETAWKKLTPEQRRRIMALLPREHCMPDESSITALVKARNGDVRIPGIEIYDIGSITVRG